MIMLAVFVFYIFVSAFAAAFLLGLLGKWGVVQWLQTHGNRFFSAMANCNFCLSWWSGVIVAVAIAAATGEAAMLLLPFCTTMLTRHLMY